MNHPCSAPCLHPLKLGSAGAQTKRCELSQHGRVQLKAVPGPWQRIPRAPNQRHVAGREAPRGPVPYILMTCSTRGIFHTVTSRCRQSLSLRSSSSPFALLLEKASRASTAFRTCNGTGRTWSKARPSQTPTAPAGSPRYLPAVELCRVPGHGSLAATCGRRLPGHGGARPPLPALPAAGAGAAWRREAGGAEPGWAPCAQEAALPQWERPRPARLTKYGPAARGCLRSALRGPPGGAPALSALVLLPMSPWYAGFLSQPGAALYGCLQGARLAGPCPACCLSPPPCPSQQSCSPVIVQPVVGTTPSPLKPSGTLLVSDLQVEYKPLPLSSEPHFLGSH